MLLLFAPGVGIECKGVGSISKRTQHVHYFFNINVAVCLFLLEHIKLNFALSIKKYFIFDNTEV